MLFLDLRTGLCFESKTGSNDVEAASRRLVTLVQHSALVLKEEKHGGTRGDNADCLRLKAFMGLGSHLHPAGLSDAFRGSGARGLGG